MKNFKMMITMAGLIIGFLPSQAVVANPLERGPVADFFNLFRQQAIPRQVVIWKHPQFRRGSVVVSTKNRRLYYVLS